MAVKVCFGIEDSRIPSVYKDKICDFCLDNDINAIGIDYIVFPASDEDVDNMDMLVEDLLMAMPERESITMELGDDIAYIIYNTEGDE